MLYWKEDCNIQGCYTLSTGKYILTFTEEIAASETSVTVYCWKRRNVLTGLNLRQQQSRNWKCCIFVFILYAACTLTFLNHCHHDNHEYHHYHAFKGLDPVRRSDLSIQKSRNLLGGCCGFVVLACWRYTATCNSLHLQILLTFCTHLFLQFFSPKLVVFWVLSEYLAIVYGRRACILRLVSNSYLCCCDSVSVTFF